MLYVLVRVFTERVFGYDTILIKSGPLFFFFFDSLRHRPYAIRTRREQIVSGRVDLWSRETAIN